MIGWEKGIDRLADMEIMPDKKQHAYGKSTALTGTDLYNVNTKSQQSGIKFIHYEDNWEQYNMTFTIWHPTNEYGDLWIFENNGQG